MNRSLYGERDYAFGQRILTLRTQLGLTQTGLAELLHVSRRAVTEWEAGSNYPKAEHLQQLIALGVQQQAFPAERKAEEIRALWHAAHQKRLFDEAWLTALLGRPRPALTWAPSGELVLSGGSDGRLHWWEVPSLQCVRVREAHQGAVQALKVSPDGSRLASCGDDGVIALWDLERGGPLRTLRLDRPYERLDITGIRGVTQAQKATLRALGAVEDAAGNNP
jgi:transcriptional regulator with XRE-family HTH domain